MQDTTFEEQLTEQRKLKGVSQKQAAKDLGISQALLSHYENGIRECGLGFVVRAAEYYGVSCDYLLGKSGNTLSLELTPHLEDIPEDGELSVNTIIRAALSMSSALMQDKQAHEYVQQLLAVTVYLMAAAGVRRGLVPAKWMREGADNLKQYKFLMESLSDSIAKLERSDRVPADRDCPESLKTVVMAANNYLNSCIADLL